MMIRKAIGFALCLSLVAAGGAAAAMQLGVRGGYAHATGDVFGGSGDLGGGGLYGVVASLELVSMLDLEFAYERYTKEFSFDDAVRDGKPFFGDAEYEDQAYLLTGKVHLIKLLPTPLGLYGGGGVSLHSIDLNVDSGDELSVPDFGREENEFEWHIVIGTDLKLPVVPILAYAEYRYQNVTGGDTPKYSSVYAGVNLHLK